MTEIADRFGPALDRTGCNLLGTLGSGATEVGLGLLIAPGFNVAGAKTLGVGALLMYAAEILCNYDEGGTGPTGGKYCDVALSGVCVDFDEGEGQLLQEYDGSFEPVGFNYKRLLSVSCQTDTCESEDSKGYCFTYRDIEYVRIDNIVESSNVILRYKPGARPILSSRPVKNDDPNIPDGACSTKPRLEPYETTDGNDCDITVQVISMAQSPGGKVAPVFLVEPGHQKQKWLDEQQWKRPQPGVIADTQARDYSQTCEFAPTLIYPTPGGDPVYVPIDPGEDIYDALKRLGDDMNDRFNDIDGDLNDLGNKLDEILEELENTDPGESFNIPPGQVTFTAVCDKDENGELQKVQYPLLGADSQNAALVAIYDNQTTMMTMLQQHLTWKTPICPPERPTLEGSFRTISFRSDEVSPYGKSRLRKRFRYRGSSGVGLGSIVDHWKDFTYSAGPVCVIHSGSSWGTPQVWAATESEGKRVIQHAGREAGIDPDQVGKWTVSSSDNARIGVSGTMRVDTTGGYYWITSRDGSDNRPIVAS